MFKLLTQKGPRSAKLHNKGASVAIAKGDILVKAASGLVVPATSSAVVSDIVGVATEAILVADARTDVHYWETFQNYEFSANTTNNTNIAHNDQRMVLTNAGEVNNTGTDASAGVVVQVGVIGAAADKIGVFKFVKTA